MRTLSLVTLPMFLLMFSACSPDDVPAGGHPKLEKTSRFEQDLKVFPSEPLQVMGRYKLSFQENSDLLASKLEIDSPETVYTCSALVEDQLIRRGEFCRGCQEQIYRLARYYTFQLEHGNRSVQLSELEFDKLALVGDQTFKVNQKLQVEAPNAEISMSFFEDQETAELSVELSVRPAQKIGDLVISDSDTKSFPYSAQRLVVKSELSAHLLLKSDKKIELAEGDQLRLQNNQVLVASDEDSEILLKTYQTESLGSLKTTVNCTLNGAN